jgi:predicted DNA-binding transcriptional regulator AlpA
MEKIALNEIELAKRWGVSPKTLQRWRTEGRGPQYLKLSKRVVYPLDQIESYEHEALHASTWEKGDDVIVSGSSQWLSAHQVATATSLPVYILTHPQVRESLGIPHARVGKQLRFRLDEVMAWAHRWTAESAAAGIEVPADERRRTLLKALASLPA